MDDIDGNNQNNMISNLPLLFANGYPTSLDKITEKQLENFIPFMVQCSLGQINTQDKIDCNEPEWWPEDIQFTIPLIKPKDFKGYWLDKLKEIVLICYQFHKSTFLLRFCNDLATYEQASLRFINNYNLTTSLYDRRNNKLLVTFRNENLSYDQPQRNNNRKCLLTKNNKSPRHGGNGDNDADKSSPQQLMVEPPLFDIYLCDYCDGEFYSFEAIKEHEKTCTADDNEDDDVIICDSPIPEITAQLPDNAGENLHDSELSEAFLSNFQLQPRNKCKKISSTDCGDSGGRRKAELVEEADSRPTEKLKRLPRRNRGIYALSRCSAIPLSSPAGQLMIKTAKTLMTEDYLYERLDRMERFCHAPVLAQGVHRPKFLDKKFHSPHVQCTFKKLMEYSSAHTYIFPRRHFMSKYRNESFLFMNSLQLKRCRPFSIRLKKYTEEQLRDIFEKRKRDNMKYNRQLLEDGRRKSQIIIDTIDLCSSDEEEDNNNPTQIMKIIKPVTQCSLNRLSVSSSSSSSLLSSSSISSTSTSLLHNGISINKLTNVPINRTVNRDDNRNVNKFEGNFLVSQTPKPLQPSVFLFSNYSTDVSSHHHRHHHHHNNHRFFNNISQNQQQQHQQQTPITNKLTQVTNYQNQENLENNLQKTSDDVTLLPANSNSNNNSSSNNNSNINNNNNNHTRTDRNNSSSTTSRVLQFMSSYRDSHPEVTISKINSPNRTISIDLTL